jgi:hypothetical protein
MMLSSILLIILCFGIVVNAAPAIKAVPATLKKSGERVTLTWSGVDFAGERTLIAIYYPPETIDKPRSMIGSHEIHHQSGAWSMSLPNVSQNGNEKKNMSFSSRFQSIVNLSYESRMIRLNLIRIDDCDCNFARL